MKLYTYFRSSAAFRVRIGLALKGISVDMEPIHLLRDGGEQFGAVYTTQNPQQLVPSLETEAGLLTQSLAILEYLDEKYPTPPLLPNTPYERALVRSMAQLIACDIHPLNNLRVLRYLELDLHQEKSTRDAWYHHWILKGFDALETLITRHTPDSPYCYANQVSLADLCLIPQYYNALRFACPLDAFPKLQKIYTHCLSLPAFAHSTPEQQPDFSSF